MHNWEVDQHRAYDSTSSLLRAAPRYIRDGRDCRDCPSDRPAARSNAYYRTCYTLLYTSQDLIFEASNKLLDLYYSNEFKEPESVSTIADDLRNDIHALIARERRARPHWDEFFQSNK